ncbi:MAG: flagellar biosynthesis protein FlgN, partial [Treponema sp.]|nr:flagellar biosynthesis protein FlgN [Treponema sp.]
MTVENLSKEELDERVAILKRFRALLEQQRTKFREYLKVLESQEKRINAEDAESLLAHTELEKRIVKGIASLQKVIVPMQDLYVK